jgi:hypothetical protein
MPGASGAALTLPSVNSADMGFYSVAVKNDDGAVESELAGLI